MSDQNDHVDGETPEAVYDPESETMDLVDEEESPNPWGTSTPVPSEQAAERLMNALFSKGGLPRRPVTDLEEVKKAKEIAQAEQGREILKTAGLTDGMIVATTMAMQAAQILTGVVGSNGGAFSGKRQVTADEIKNLTTYLLATGEVIDQNATGHEPVTEEISATRDGDDIVLGPLPKRLRPFEAQIKDQIRRAMANGANAGVVTGVEVEHTSTGLTDVDDDGRVWHFLPASQLELGTITAEFQVVGEPDHHEESRTVTALIQTNGGEPEEKSWADDVEIRMLCQGCTFERQITGRYTR